jgi:tRNA nucleotidyltransferase/poly(A) polymerase
MIIDDTDNTDYFLYKFNISKKDQKRIKNIDNFYKEKINSKTFTENNMNKTFYYLGKQSTFDILNHRIVKLNKEDSILKELVKHYEIMDIPKMPINADFLMKKYEIPKGKQLGEKLKIIEKEWVKNNFKISKLQVDNIINN